MTPLDDMYLPEIRQVLGTEAGQRFFVYILRKLKYCDILKTQDDVVTRNAAVRLLEDMMDIAGIQVNVLTFQSTRSSDATI